MFILNSLQKYLYRQLIDPILQSKDSPHLVAMGAAIGMFIAFTPTVGIQMSLVLMVAILPGLHFNVPVAIAMVWLTNPITMWPIYYVFYRFGLLILGRTGDSWVDFKQKIVSILSNLDHLPWLQKFYEGFHGFFLLGLHYAIPMIIGSLIIAIILAILTYPFAFWLAKKYSEKNKLLLPLDISKKQPIPLDSLPVRNPEND
ncbi:MAG: DUF2062 domain-containing protein [Planctomycetota bacterium]